ncbi:hypothetical protein [Veronia nyctiphanis]|uniref:hypothetical protein n=1 Tax=Veronia nyctiphanis TaxID=1278244 RepID=UPI00100B481B|nr:hypothetical protein [Veronia nyctiphanis]
MNNFLKGSDSEHDHDFNIANTSEGFRPEHQHTEQSETPNVAFRTEKPSSHTDSNNRDAWNKL